jgi:hypothetical protein
LLFIFGIAVIVVFVHQATDYSSPAGVTADELANAPEAAAAANRKSAETGRPKVEEHQSAA